MKRLRLTTYNTFLGGLDTSNRFMWDIAHFFYFVLHTQVFLRHNVKKLQRSLRFSLEETPDVVVLTEIPSYKDKSATKKFLTLRGYNPIFSGTSRHFKNRRFELSVIIGSKLKAQSFELPTTLINSAWGCCALYLKEINSVVIGVHLSLREGERKKEFSALREIVGREINKQRKVIIAGDFNAPPEEIREQFKNTRPQLLNLYTFTHWLLPERAVDNVLVFGGQNLTGTATSDLSDHKKIYSEIDL